MLSMSQYELIKTAYRVYGKSIRQIAGEYGHSRKTVRKALRETKPAYERRKEPDYPVMGTYERVILSWLKSDVDMPKKQRHTARRVYTRLLEEHEFSGAESTVRRFVRQLRIAEGLYRKEAFVPLEADAGREGEVDWGEAVARIAGERRQIYLFCMRSRYSGKDFVRAYPNARQEMFFDGHNQAFDYYGGVFPTLVYDNLTSAVQRVFKGGKRLEQEAFRTFRAWYTFEARFCNPGKGNEKGGVEGLVGYARRNYLVPIPEVDSFAELNELLLSRCLASGRRRISGKEETIDALFSAEQNRLLKLPAAAYPVRQLTSAVVEHYSTVRADHNRYSVPTDYVGLNVAIDLQVEQVVICYNRKEVGRHARVFGKNKWQLDPYHYLKLLIRKPGAFDAARPIRQWRGSWPVCYERLLSAFRDKNGHGRGTKEFIKVLLLTKTWPARQLESSIEQALGLFLSGAASVKLLLEHRLSEEEPVERLAEGAHPHPGAYRVEPPEVGAFGALLSGEGGGR